MVAECAVIVQPDKVRRFTPIAFVQLEESGTDQILQELYNVSQNHLPEHMQPSHINILDKMPMTASGKIDYRALEEMVTQPQQGCV